jgi:hypothetical protein
MHTVIYRSFCGAVLCGLVLACGSGGGVDAPPPVIPPTSLQSELASPALAIASGQASKNFDLTGCFRVADSKPITSANLSISGNGNISFSGSIDSSPPTQLAFLNQSETNQRQLLVRAESASITSEFALFTSSKRIDISTLDNRRFVYSEPVVQIYKCEPGPATTSFTIEQPLTSSRIVSSIVANSSSTVSLVPSSVASGNYTQTGSVVSWDSGRTGTFARFISFNLDTAELAQGSSLNPTLHSPVLYALPISGSAVTANYVEYLNPNGNKEVTFKYDNIDLRYTRIATNNTRQFRFSGSP